MHTLPPLRGDPVPRHLELGQKVVGRNYTMEKQEQRAHFTATDLEEQCQNPPLTERGLLRDGDTPQACDKIYNQIQEEEICPLFVQKTQAPKVTDDLIAQSESASKASSKRSAQITGPTQTVSTQASQYFMDQRQGVNIKGQQRIGGNLEPTLREKPKMDARPAAFADLRKISGESSILEKSQSMETTLPQHSLETSPIECHGLGEHLRGTTSSREGSSSSSSSSGNSSAALAKSMVLPRVRLPTMLLVSISARLSSSISI